MIISGWIYYWVGHEKKQLRALKIPFCDGSCFGPMGINAPKQDSAMEQDGYISQTRKQRRGDQDPFQEPLVTQDPSTRQLSHTSLMFHQLPPSSSTLLTKSLAHWWLRDKIQL